MRKKSPEEIALENDEITKTSLEMMEELLTVVKDIAGMMEELLDYLRDEEEEE